MNLCEICNTNQATQFMVAKQTDKLGKPRVAKAHVCLGCLEIVRADEVPAGFERNGVELFVESISAQDYAETITTTP